MPTAAPLQPSLNAGEFGPRMVARTDFAKYPLACATLENMLPLPQGGAARRPGTVFVAEVKDSVAKVRLIPFEFSTAQAYVVEAGNGYFRFYKDRGRIMAADVTGTIANGTFDTTLASWTARDTGTGVSQHNAAGKYMELSGGSAGVGWREQLVASVTVGVAYTLRFRVIGSPGDAVQLRVGTSSTGSDIVNDVAFASGRHCTSFTATATGLYIQFRNATGKFIGIDDVAFIDNGPIEIATPYLESELFALKWAQSADVLYVCHAAHPVMKLNRTGHTAWSLVEVAFDDGPYLRENSTATTLAPSATSGLGITITASAATFSVSDVGRLVRIKHGTSWGNARVTAFTNATQVSADVKSAFGGTTASAAWRLGAWGTVQGFPGTVTFFEQRLVFAATVHQPQTLWFSQSADFENMRPDNGSGTVEDDDALDYTISADQVNAIRWLFAGRQLLVGTVGGEWLVASDGPLITPADIDVKRQTAFGSAELPPVSMRGRLAFLQRAQRKVLEFVFSLDLDNFQAHDLCILANHVTKSGIVAMAYQQEPDSALWCVRGDGEIASMTYQPDQNVVGWSRQVLGGRYDGGKPVAECVATIPGASGDELWLSVKRTIGGVTRKYIEYLAAPFESGEDQAGAVYVDASLAMDNAVAATLTPGAITGFGVTFTAGSAVFGAGDVGREIHHTYRDDSGAWRTARALVVGYLGPTQITADISVAFPSTVTIASQAWRLTTTSAAGLDHLEGETVTMLADGAPHPSRVVSAGAVQFDYPVGRAQIGLAYAHVYQSLKWESGTGFGTAQGQIKRIHGVTLMLLDSLNAEVGPSPESLKSIPFRLVDDAMNTAIPLFTGEKFVEFDGDYATDTRVVVRGSEPAPFTLLAVAPRVQTNPR